MNGECFVTAGANAIGRGSCPTARVEAGQSRASKSAPKAELKFSLAWSCDLPERDQYDGEVPRLSRLREDVFC
jgi:hypothetical protein